MSAYPYVCGSHYCDASVEIFPIFKLIPINQKPHPHHATDFTDEANNSGDMSVGSSV